MYDRGSSESSVKGVRLVIFTQIGRKSKNTRTTQDALAQHELRVGYEAGRVQGKKRLKPHSFLAQQTFGGLGRWPMHKGMQTSVQVQEGRLDVHNVVQVWWMLIRQLVHVAH